MQNIGDKVDNTPGVSGELTAAEYNDHKNEFQETVISSGQTLSNLDTPDQASRGIFIYAASAQSVQDAAPSANVIELTPVTGASGLIVPDAYAQMDGMVLEFTKITANTSSTVTVNFGQTGGTLLGAKSLKKQDGANPLIGMVRGTLRIYFDVGSDYWVILPYGNVNVQKGYIQTELEISGTNLIINSPEIEIDNLLVKQSDVTIDLTALTASTWYALCCNETSGAITAQNISSVFNTGGGGNWDISGNQLDIYDSIWDSVRKYCRAYDATNYYRVFGVFKTNSTPDGVNHLFYIPNIPKTKISVVRDALFTIPSSVATPILYNNIIFDINNEYTIANGRYTPKHYMQNPTIDFFVDQLTTSTTGERLTIIATPTSVTLNLNSQTPPAASTSVRLGSTKKISTADYAYYTTNLFLVVGANIAANNAKMTVL